MKKFLIFVAIGVAILILLCGAGIAFIVQRASTLDAGGRAFADAAIVAIARDWNEKELLDRASPEFKRETTIDNLDRMFRWFGTLGRLQNCAASQGHAEISITFAEGKKIRGTFTANAQFEKGGAEITFHAIKHGEQWQILGFEVDSPALATP